MSKAKTVRNMAEAQIRAGKSNVTGSPQLIIAALDELEKQVAELTKERDGYAKNASFYRCCMLGGELAEPSDAPYQPAQPEGDEG